ncbi:hypothetical protein ID866_3382 [Astraeus odoratus]|nr:hypothetical protein ID866_3382 [Astraeus odoratus]
MEQQTNSCLTQLPVELLCQILGYLAAQELARARQAIIKNVIDHSELLRYIMDLGFFRMQEIPSDGRRVPITTRRKELRVFEASWRNLRYRRRCNFPLLASGPVYEFVGGIYACEGEDCLHFSVLPHGSHTESQPIRTWDHPVDTNTMVDFTFCPSQDLLVIVDTTPNDHRHCYDLHLRSIMTNKPHPHAAQPVLKVIEEPDDERTIFYHATGRVKIQVFGKYIAILCRDIFANEDEMGDYLELWKWMTDKSAKFTMRFVDSMNDFVFLAEDRLLLVADDGTIEIFSFVDGPAPISPKCTARLAMPSLMEDWQLADTFLGGNPAPVPGTSTQSPRPWAESEHPSPMFHPTTDDQLLAFHVTAYRMSNAADMHSFAFFMFRSELLGLQTLYERFLLEDPEKTSLDYAIWGKTRTHWFRDNYVDWQNSVYGYRTVELVNESPIIFSTEPRRLRVRDFNPNLLFFKTPHLDKEDKSEHEHRLERSLIAHDEPERGALMFPIPHLPAKVRAKIIGVFRPFAELLGMVLPYREVISTEAFDATEVMMDESRILLFNRVSATIILSSIAII